MADENRDSGVDRAGKEAFTALQQPIWPAGDGEMASRIRAFDWSVTPLGPSVGWPQSLKTVVDLMLDSAFPSYVWWGPDLIQFCNDPAIEINGTKHPGLL